MLKAQKETLLAFVWDSLPKDSENPDRRETVWGSKTRKGLAACLRRLTE